MSDDSQEVYILFAMQHIGYSRKLKITYLYIDLTDRLSELILGAIGGIHDGLQQCYYSLLCKVLSKHYSLKGMFTSSIYKVLNVNNTALL